MFPPRSLPDAVVFTITNRTGGTSESEHLTRPRWLASQPGDVAAIAAAWLTSPELATLTRALGGPVIRSIPADLAAAAEWSQHALDTRGGAERHEAPAARRPGFAIPPLLSAGRALGLMSTGGPRLGSYDLTVILGGTATGNRLRTALAASFAQRDIDLGVVAGLTADRPLTAAERRVERLPAAEDSEWQNLLRELGGAFGSGRDTQVLVAPPAPGSQRADTRASVDYLTGQIAPAARRRVLIVTSAIYAPYQFFIAAPGLTGAGTGHAELVGTPTGTAGDQTLLAQRIAQEIHSAITAACRLWPASGAGRGGR
ncbi:MAG: hypothetical protein JO016_16290 [Actinobacteria bacterium]|nr:hypothetical protein [Actinomycetota bacterium]